MNHSRDVYSLEEAAGPEEAFADSLGRGRLHHAWLLIGAEGVGKATFAYRAARRLLGAAPDATYGLLGSDPEHPVSRQVAARSHPDLMVLEREGEDGKVRRSIPVDEARKLPEFFSKAPASAPYRVAIVDAADDLNVSSANALLKTLEEPPSRGVLFLVSHNPGRLLPTIRSRCRRLLFKPWPIDATTSFVLKHSDVSDHDARALAEMSGGSPGKALTLAADKALEIDEAAKELLRALPKRDDAALMALADRFRGAEGGRRFELLFQRLAERVSEMTLRQGAEGDLEGLEGWAGAWDELIRTPRIAEGLNLDKADAFWTAMDRLQAAARR